MPVLDSQQRRDLERACTDGRRAAEAACQAAITALAVTEERVPAHLGDEARELRVALRAKARQLGDPGGTVDLLVAECAYEQWHLLLFARFLAENNLLIHPAYHSPVTLDECEQLAIDLDEPDGWSVAARFAAEILPGIFRPDDPCVRMRLAPEGRLALEGILAGLPPEVFTADDALGWAYQYWQKDKKDEVNASERKVGGADLAPVTQLFTEHYMVRFLLENSLGAWWAARHPDSPLLAGFEYLRFDDDGNPAAGSFEQWPKTTAEVTIMDPCCGSGHFLVEAFSMLWRMRAEEEALTPVEAQDAVLRDNLFGLELDPRCVQIATFAVALHAWKDGGGWRALPVPNIACSGIPLRAPLDEWLALTEGDGAIEEALRQLYEPLCDADTLGSLIDPWIAGTQADWQRAATLLSTARLHSYSTLARTVTLLAARYSLVATNVPFLGRRHQAEVLASFLQTAFPDAKADLATAMIKRCCQFAQAGGSLAIVSPQSWTTLDSFRRFREDLLANTSFAFYARLGARAFRSISGEIVKVTLTIASTTGAAARVAFPAISAEPARSPEAKAQQLRLGPVISVPLGAIRSAPDRRIVLEMPSTSTRLSDYVDVFKGLTTGDDPRFRRRFWELPKVQGGWTYLQTGSSSYADVDGCHDVVDRAGLDSDPPGGYRPMSPAPWGQAGIAVGHVGQIGVNHYQGTRYDQSIAVLVPRDPSDYGAVWHYARSPRFPSDLRALDSAVKVTDGSLVKVPFEVEYWQEIAASQPLIQPATSPDPTQWLFKGRAEDSTDPLQVAVARMLGYRWPEQEGDDELDALADADGVVGIPSLAGEAPAAERLRTVLATAFGSGWSPAKERELLEATGSTKANLDDWLRGDFFKQHCTLFQDRPFIWQIWDGTSDGFSALINYHRLDRALLEKVTFTYLRDWIERVCGEVSSGVAGADKRLAAATALQGSLKQILDGAPPFDIYVRWKPLKEQPIGWEPDINDGVRLNIRPFIEAGVLRAKPKVHWKKDRGKNADGSERLNDLHFTNAEKRAAR